ncbi:MAG TPA: lysylphosphatidylglycerol synthase transmembrane domain-containing protein [Vicinamibacterales bacterium]|nr:lysylphosphatidylglycerol synthase transmembrane domain-containing protein [Vicinamibacterales bacterium]
MAPPDLPRRALSRIATTAAKLVLSVGLLAFVLRGTSPQAMWAVFRRVQPLWLIAAFAANGVVMAVSIWRWRILLAAQHVMVPVRTLSESYWVALFFNNFLPSNIGGDVVRIADTSQVAGSKTLATTVVLVDRVLGAFAVLTVGAVGAAAARAFGIDIPGTGWLEVAALAALAVCIPLFVAPALLDMLLRPLHSLGHPWVIERLEMLQDALGRFRSRPSSLIGALGGALVVQIVIVVFYALTARSLSIPLPVMMAGVLVPVALVVQMAPVSINGFGVREAVFSFFFVRFGLGVDAGIAVSLLGTALIMAFSLGGGALFLLRRH